MDALISHPFPMIRAGGAFLIIAGFFFAIGWIFPRLFGLFMTLAFGAGFMAAYTVLQLPPDLGPVGVAHWSVLAFAIALEAVALVWMYRVVKEERRSDAWVLIIVGLHFAPMAVILGPLALALAAATTLNGVLALRAAATPILPFGLIDSGLKVGFGAAMFFAYPTFGAALSLDRFLP